MLGFNHGHKWNKDGIDVFCDLCGCKKDSVEAKEKCTKRHESHFETTRPEDDDFVPFMTGVAVGSSLPNLPDTNNNLPADNSEPTAFAGGESGGAGAGADFADTGSSSVSDAGSNLSDSSSSSDFSSNSDMGSGAADMGSSNSDFGS